MSIPAGLGRPELPSRLSPRDRPGARGSRWKPPASIRKALPAKPSRNELLDAKQAALEGWLRLLTGSCFESPPPLAEGGPLADTDRVRVHPERPIVTTEPGGDRICVACNGRARTLQLPAPARRRLQRLAASLSDGAPRSVSELEAAFFKGFSSPRFKRPALRALLDELASWRALLRA